MKPVATIRSRTSAEARPTLAHSRFAPLLSGKHYRAPDDHPIKLKPSFYLNTVILLQAQCECVPAKTGTHSHHLKRPQFLSSQIVSGARLSYFGTGTKTRVILPARICCAVIIHVCWGDRLWQHVFFPPKDTRASMSQGGKVYWQKVCRQVVMQDKCLYYTSALLTC